MLAHFYFMGRPLRHIADLVRRPMSEVAAARRSLVEKLARAMGYLPGGDELERATLSMSTEERRRRVVELWAQGFRVTAIAEQLGVAQCTVSRDLRALREEDKLPVYTLTDVARLTGTTKQNILGMVRRGRLIPSAPLQPGRIPRFTKEAVEAFLRWREEHVLSRKTGRKAAEPALPGGRARPRRRGSSSSASRIRQAVQPIPKVSWSYEHPPPEPLRLHTADGGVRDADQASGLADAQGEPPCRSCRALVVGRLRGAGGDSFDSSSIPRRRALGVGSRMQTLVRIHPLSLRDGEGPVLEALGLIGHVDVGARPTGRHGAGHTVIIPLGRAVVRPLTSRFLRLRAGIQHAQA